MKLFALAVYASWASWNAASMRVPVHQRKLPPPPALHLALPSNGCGQTTTLPRAQSSMQELVDAGSKVGRTYVVTLPWGYDATRPYPLVLGFHGYASNGPHMASIDGAVEQARQGKSIVVHPEASADSPDIPLARAWNAMGSSARSGESLATCDIKAPPSFIHRHCFKSCGVGCPPCSWASCSDDVAFVAKLLDTLEAQLCVDRSRVRAHGLSNGGMMVFQLLQSHIAERFEALVSVAGSPLRGTQQAPMTHSVRFFGLWSPDDRVVPMAGVPDEISNEGLYFSSASNATRTIAHFLGCQAAVVPVVESQASLQCLAFPGCSHGIGGFPNEVVSCAFGGGHGWPPKPIADLIYDFYDSGVEWPVGQTASPGRPSTLTAASAEKKQSREKIASAAAAKWRTWRHSR